MGRSRSPLTKVRPMRRIPISAAKVIADAYGYDQVVVMARRVGAAPDPCDEHITTYGVDRDHCASAAAQGRALAKFMGWEAVDADDE